MKTEQKQKLIEELIPYLNSLQSNEIATNGKKYNIVAEAKRPITFQDLVALSDVELEALQQLMYKAKAAKKTLDRDKEYEGQRFNDYTLTHESNKQFTIK